ncbi:MAG TPA: tetratricopeptide repeat protein [Flavitalea sp.]|nr:tetratricopeptide repeat protein [Flavitalea sp.]
MPRYLLTCMFVIILFCSSTIAQDITDDLFLEAKKEVHQENYQKAVELFMKFLNNPKNQTNFNKYETYRYKAFCNFYLKNYTDAINDADSLLYYQNFFPDNFFANPPKKVMRGLAFLMKGDCNKINSQWKEAVVAYDSALYYQGKDDGNLYWKMGWCKENLGKYKEAEKDYEKATRLISDKKELAVIYLNRGNCQYQLSNIAQAISFYTKSLSYDPTDNEAYRNRGICYFDMKDADKGRADLLAVIANEKDDIKKSGVYTTLGFNESQVLDYANGISHLNKALEIDPLNGWAYYRRAQLYGYVKNYTAAIADCNMAIRIYKVDSNKIGTLMVQKALCYNKSGNYDEAVKEYEEILKMYPDSYTTLYDLGRVLKTRLKNNERAKEILTKAGRLALESGDTTEYYYIMLFNDGQEEAVRKMAELIEKNRADKYEYKWALYNMACTYALVGNNKKAVEYLNKSFAAGFDAWLHLMNDGDLTSLTNLPEWKAIMTKYKVPAPKY